MAETSSDSPRRPLEGYYRDLLVDGPPLDMRPDQAVLVIAHAARRAAWAWSDFYGAMTDPRHQLALAVARRGSVFNRLSRWWALAHDRVASDPLEVRARLAAFRAEADGIVWRGRGASTERLVYEGILIICGDRGVFVSTIGWRDLELATTIPYRTCGKALDRLVKEGLVKRLYRGEGSYAGRIQPVSPQQAFGQVRSGRTHSRSLYAVSSGNPQNEERGSGGNWENATSTFIPKLSLREILASDIMAVLTPATVRVLYLISSGGQSSASAMAARLGIGKATCCQSLEALAGMGLVVQRFQMWQPTTGLRAQMAGVAAAHAGFHEAISARISRERAERAADRHYGQVRAAGAVRWTEDGQPYDDRTGEVIAMPALGRR